MNRLKRFWRELWCKHYNQQKEWNDGEGWNIKVCSRCHRAVIFTDDNRRHSKHKTELH